MHGRNHQTIDPRALTCGYSYSFCLPYFSSWATHPFRDGAPFPLLTDTPPACEVVLEGKGWRVEGGGLGREGEFYSGEGFVEWELKK